MPDKPTSRQLNYLRALTNRTGQTFTYPTTVAEASREIERLKQAQPATRSDNRLIDREIADAIACGDADATRVRSSEVSGHGSSATWAHHREPHPPAATRPVNRRPPPAVGQRTELARYTVAGAERVLYGQRVDGVVRFQPGGRDVLVVSSQAWRGNTCCPCDASLEAARTERRATSTFESWRRHARAAN